MHGNYSRQGGGGGCTGMFCTRQFCTGFILHSLKMSGLSGLKIARGGRSNGPYADSFPLPCHFQGGGGQGLVGGLGGQLEGRKQVSKRSTHACPGMHMQQCPAVPHDHWYDTRVLPYNCLHLMAFVLSTRQSLYATKQEKAPCCYHLSPESPYVCWHSLAK